MNVHAKKKFNENFYVLQNSTPRCKLRFTGDLVFFHVVAKPVFNSKTLDGQEVAIN